MDKEPIFEGFMYRSKSWGEDRDEITVPWYYARLTGSGANPGIYTTEGSAWGANGGKDPLKRWRWPRQAEGWGDRIEIKIHPDGLEEVWDNVSRTRSFSRREVIKVKVMPE